MTQETNEADDPGRVASDRSLVERVSNDDKLWKALKRDARE